MRKKENNDQSGLRFLQYCLIVCVLFLLTACGTNNSGSADTSDNSNVLVGNNSDNGNNDSSSNSAEAETGSAVEVPEWLYVPQMLTIAGENIDYDDIQLAGDTLCYLSRGEDVENAVRNICQYSLTDQKLTTIPIGWQDGSGNGEFGVYTFAGDRSLYVTVYSYSADYSQMKRLLCKFDSEGKNLFSQDITEQLGNNSSVSGMTVDGQGQVYIFTYDGGILQYHEDGSYGGSATYDSPENIMIKDAATGNDGKLYVRLGKDDDPDYCTLAEVDFETGQITKIGSELPGIKGFCIGGTQDGDPAHQCDFLLYDDSFVYTYDMAAQKMEELFFWLDSDINGDSVECFGMTEDGSFYVTYEDWKINDAGVTLLTRTGSDQVAQKENLVLAAVNGESSLAAMAVNFNKNNTQYHLTVKNYDSMTDLYNSILANDSIDLIDLSGVSVQKMYSQGVFEDLTPYLNQSSKFVPTDFVDGILDTYTFNGTLVSIPATFALQTVVGDRSQIGDQEGLSLDELFTLTDSHPGVQPFDGITREEMMRYLMMFNEEAFVDWSTGECRFDSEDFKKALEFVKQFPDAIDASREEEESLPTKIQNGKVMFAIADINGFKNLQPYEEMFRGNAACIGFPSTDGTRGNLLITGDAFAIAARSQHKEGAWMFIENELTRGNESCYPGVSLLPTDLPTLKEALDVVVDNGMERDSQIPIDRFPKKKYSDGWIFTYHPTTREEVNAILDLVKEARPALIAGDDEIIMIIHEEAQAYYSGQKSVDDVVNIIQNRVSLYVSENM